MVQTGTDPEPYTAYHKVSLYIHINKCTPLEQTPVPLHIYEVIQSAASYFAAAKWIRSFRHKWSASVKDHIKYQNGEKVWFNCDMDVGCRWAGLSSSDTSDLLGFSLSLDSLQGLHKGLHKHPGCRGSAGWNTAIDERRMNKVVWADMKSIVTYSRKASQNAQANRLNVDGLQQQKTAAGFSSETIIGTDSLKRDSWRLEKVCFWITQTGPSGSNNDANVKVTELTVFCDYVNLTWSF